MLSFSLATDETLAVVGPSGCGKTTLLYMLCGLEQPDAGQVFLDGKPVLKPGRDTAIILQDYGLLPWRTALDNVALGLKIQGVGPAERRKQAAEWLARIGLAGREQAYPSCLSGGEKQRVAIARALVCRPRLLLMDEPFSSLDAITREKLQNDLLAAWRETRVPYVLVTHSVDEAAFLARRIMVLAGCPARVKAEFANPECGTREYRNSETFHAMTRKLREAMGELW